MIIAASPGSSRWIASPVGMSDVAPGASVMGASMQARRSSPAEPAVAYAGRFAPIRGSRILTSSFFRRLASAA
jgi:hypothetical protein